MKTCFTQLLLLLSCFLLANFEVQAKGLSEFRANLEIDLKDIKQPKQIKLVFEMYTNVNLNYTLQKSTYDYEIKSSITHIVLPLTDSLNYGRIKLWIDNVPYQFNHDNNLFLFAEGDQIKMSLEDKKVSFLGKGCEKYNCLNMLYQSKGHLSELVQQAYDRKDYEAMFLASFTAFENEAKQKQQILDSYKQIESKARTLIEVDLWAQMLRKMQASLHAKIIATNSYSIFHKSVGTMLKKYEDLFDERRYSEVLLARSFYYVSYLYDLNVLRCIYTNAEEGKGYNFRFTFTDLTKQIELQKYPDQVRSKLYLLAFYRNYNQNYDTLSGIQLIMDTLGDNAFKQAISTFYNQIYKSVYDFTLKDARGRDVSLKKFKGKVIVLDFWFTGCLGCKILAKELDPIIESYKHDKRVVFISINIDKDKKSWTQSLSVGDYTSKDAINLYTGGLQYTHPIIKSYNILSYPTLLIISREGLLITASPPKLIKDNVESVLEFKKLINSYL